MTLHIKPNPDKKVDGKPLKVRDPISNEFIPKSGKRVPRSAYWVRRLRDGDVVEVNEKAAQTAAPAKGGPDADALGLEDAIKKCLAADDKAHLGEDGKPDCNVLSNLTGVRVTKKMRDDAMTAMEAK